MFPYLPSSLDRLSSEGIVNFDSESYIKGQPPRYIGAPSHYLPFEQPLNTYEPNFATAPAPAGPQLKPQPADDQFVNNNKSNSKTWKTILLAGIGATLLAVVGVKYGKTIAGWFKKKPAPATPPAPPAPASNANGSWIKRTWSKITSGAKNIWTKTADGTKRLWNKIPKWGRITGGVVAGALVLLGIIKLVTHKKNKAQ